jgi:hypothetical protein
MSVAMLSSMASTVDQRALQLYAANRLRQCVYASSTAPRMRLRFGFRERDAGSVCVCLLDHRKGPRYRGPERIGNISALPDYGAHSLVPFRVSDPAEMRACRVDLRIVQKSSCFSRLNGGGCSHGRTALWPRPKFPDNREICRDLRHYPASSF